MSTQYRDGLVYIQYDEIYNDKFPHNVIVQSDIRYISTEYRKT